jgi:ubiquinone/menaquinone biosynthesis C-methylase UbiE
LDIYDKEYYDSDRQLSHLRLVNTISLLGNIQEKKILDLGCGTGEGSALLKESGAETVCVDISKYALLVCHRAGFPVVLAIAHCLPFRRDCFDGALLADLVEHIPHNLVIKVLSEINRIIKPKGRVAIHTMPNFLLEKLSMLYGLVNRKHWRRWGTQGGHVNTYTSWSLRKIIKLSGLEIHSFIIGNYPKGAPFSSIISPISVFFRGLLGNDFWVSCTISDNSGSRRGTT